MKHIIKRILLEQTSGLNEFLNKVKETYDIDDEFIDKINQFILNSDCKKIMVQNILKIWFILQNKQHQRHTKRCCKRIKF